MLFYFLFISFSYSIFIFIIFDLILVFLYGKKALGTVTSHGYDRKPYSILKFTASNQKNYYVHAGHNLKIGDKHPIIYLEKKPNKAYLYTPVFIWLLIIFIIILGIIMIGIPAYFEFT